MVDNVAVVSFALNGVKASKVNPHQTIQSRDSGIPTKIVGIPENWETIIDSRKSGFPNAKSCPCHDPTVYFTCRLLKFNSTIIAASSCH